MVTYNKQTVDATNPLARFSHRNRVSRSIALAEKKLCQGGVVVDFGAGTGSFLSALGDKRPDATLCAIEPFMSASTDSRIHYIPDFKSSETKVDLICAFEVCEHLTDDQTEQFLCSAKDALQENGSVLISVPIMIGGVLLLKEMNRAFMFRRASDYSAKEMIAGVLGHTVQRPEFRLETHKGFDFRWLRKQICNHFTIESEILSPLPLPWWMNSQVFFICRGK